MYGSGWGTRARTLISGVRVRCLTIRPSPSMERNEPVYLENPCPPVKEKEAMERNNQEIITPA